MGKQRYLVFGILGEKSLLILPYNCIFFEKIRPKTCCVPILLYLCTVKFEP